MPLPMRSALLLLPLLLAALSPASVVAEAPPAPAAAATTDIQVIRIQADDPMIRGQVGELVGHLHYDADSGSATLEADPHTRSRLAGLDIPWQVDMPATAQLQAFLAEAQGGSQGIPGFECYRTVEETLATMAQLADAYPQLVEIVTIGESWQRVQNAELGYPLQVLRLTNRHTRGPKPVMFAMSAIHAREYTPAELMTRFAEQLLAGYGEEADATWLLDHNEFHLLLQANPDGRKRAEQNVLWRKNTNTVAAPCSTINGSYHPGIDLNRNYPWGWMSSGTSASARCAATYSGPAPASEPETQAVTDYLLTIFPDRRPGNPQDPSIPAAADTQGLFLDMHSYTGLVLWPWGTSGTTGNNQAFVTLGRRLAWFNDYAPQQSVLLYPTRGTTVDFAYGELGVPAFTYELGQTFFKSCGQFESVVLPDNLASLRYAARTLHAPYRLPAGPDLHDVQAMPAHLLQGHTLTVQARVDDRGYRHGPGAAVSVPQMITGARLHLNRLPWQPGHAALEMTPADGAFDAAEEHVQLSVSTRSFLPGRHLLVIQGENAGGHAGPPAAVFVDILPDPDRIFGHDFQVAIQPR